jgi:diguanylate cyclase (GGDEF)-like protein
VATLGDAVSAIMPSTFIIDLPTLCAVTVFVVATGGLLLLFSWLQNRTTPALAFWGFGYLIGAAAAVLFAARGFIPDAVSVVGANALLCLAYGVLWGGARCFEGRRVDPVWIVSGAALWLAACMVGPLFYESVEARIALASIVLASYALLGAREIWHARDPQLISRWPTFALVLLHVGFLLARVPLANTLSFPIGDGPPHSVSTVVMALEALFAAFALAFLRLAMAKERAELQQRRAASLDPLTGVANRRAFFDLGGPLFERAVNERRPAALLLFDLDRFKQVNDTAGHQAGDHVLKGFSDLAASSMRDGDLFGRIGGEEFACLLLDISMPAALQIAERLRREFEAVGFACPPTCATVSIGVAAASPAERDLRGLVAAADRALYRAKAKGRNRVEPARPPLALIDTLETAAG